MYSWEDMEANSKNEEVMPCVVNPIVFEVDYLTLEAPQKINRLLKKHGFLTVGDIVHSTDTTLIEKYGFTLEDTQSLDKCLNKIGCCLPPGGAFSKKISDEECDEDFEWDDSWAVEVSDTMNTGGNSI